MTDAAPRLSQVCLPVSNKRKGYAAAAPVPLATGPTGLSIRTDVAPATCSYRVVIGQQGDSVSDTTYTIDARGTATAAAAIKELRTPCEAIERELGTVELPSTTYSIGATLGEFGQVWRDATSALGDSLTFLGDQVVVAVANYGRSEADSTGDYDTRRGGRREAI